MGLGGIIVYERTTHQPKLDQTPKLCNDDSFDLCNSQYATQLSIIQVRYMVFFAFTVKLITFYNILVNCSRVAADIFLYII